MELLEAADNNLNSMVIEALEEHQLSYYNHDINFVKLI